MTRQTFRIAAATVALTLALAGCNQRPVRDASASAPPDPPRVTAASEVAAGEYLTTVGACNDCHTPGWMETGGKIAAENRLVGSTVGWRGPWGTTYPKNLRLTVTKMSADQWVAMLRTRQGLPPMPWMNFSAMTDGDLRAIYAYLRFLGPKGPPAPDPLPPGEEPRTPYLSMFPRNAGT